jgi:hypothetical protein
VILYSSNVVRDLFAAVAISSSTRPSENTSAERPRLFVFRFWRAIWRRQFAWKSYRSICGIIDEVLRYSEIGDVDVVVLNEDIARLQIFVSNFLTV